MHSKACVLQYTFNSVTRKLNSLIVSYFCVLSRVLILSMVLTTLWCLYDSVTPLLLCSYTPCNIFQIVIKTCTWNTWLNWSNKRHTFLENTNFKQELHFFPLHPVLSQPLHTLKRMKTCHLGHTLGTER